MAITFWRVVLFYRLDGGVSRNNFLVQQISDILQKPIHRSTHSEMTSLGAAFIAGLSAGLIITFH